MFDLTSSQGATLCYMLDEVRVKICSE